MSFNSSISAFWFSTRSFKSPISSSWSSIIFCRFSTSSSFFQNCVGNGPGLTSTSPNNRCSRYLLYFHKIENQNLEIFNLKVKFFSILLIVVVASFWYQRPEKYWFELIQCQGGSLLFCFDTLLQTSQFYIYSLIRINFNWY